MFSLAKQVLLNIGVKEKAEEQDRFYFLELLRARKVNYRPY